MDTLLIDLHTCFWLMIGVDNAHLSNWWIAHGTFLWFYILFIVYLKWWTCWLLTVFIWFSLIISFILIIVTCIWFDIGIYDLHSGITCNYWLYSIFLFTLIFMTNIIMVWREVNDNEIMTMVMLRMILMLLLR